MQREALRRCFGNGLFELRRDDNGGLAKRVARVLIDRGLEAAGDHEAKVGAVGHFVSGEDFGECLRDVIAGAADIEVDGGGALVEAVEVCGEEEEFAAVYAQALPDAVAQGKSGVEDGDLCVGAWDECAVDVDEGVGVAWVRGGVLASGHGRPLGCGGYGRVSRDLAGGQRHMVLQISCFGNTGLGSMADAKKGFLEEGRLRRGRREQAGKATVALRVAEKMGLLEGPKTKHFNAKVSPALFDAAARRVGTTSPAAVINAALAALATEDDLLPWLARNWGALADIPPELLEQIEF